MSDPARPPADRYRDGVVLALPLAVAVALFGVSFGVLARGSAGMGVVAPIVMSMTSFGGSAQFAAVSVLAAGGGPAAAIIAAVLLNLRYLAIGASVAPSIRGGPVRRFLIGQLVVDESWAIAARPGGRFEIRVLIGAGITLWLAWTVSTVVGVLGGDALGDVEAIGLDAAFPALFLALLAPQLRSRRAATAAGLGAAIGLALLPFTPPGVSIIAAAGAALIGWVRR